MVSSKINQAISDFTRAIEIDRDFVEAYFHRGHAYFKNEEWDKAIADYTEVIKRNPNMLNAYKDRGRAWEKIGDTDKAAEDFARYLGVEL